MTSQEWSGQWKRLDQFRVPDESKRAALGAEWFKHLRHWHVDAVERGITEIIGEAKDTFLPGLGVLKDRLQARIDRYAQTHGGCQTCHGSTWVEAWPWWDHGRVYTGLQRCPDCGVPAPSIVVPEGRRRLTAAEYAAWKDGTLEQVQEPVARSRRQRTTGHGMSTFTAPKGMP